MRALTLKPHWAHAIAHMGKRIENRRRPPARTAIGTRIAIHAGSESGFRLPWIDEWDAVSGMSRAEQFVTPVPVPSDMLDMRVVLPGFMHCRAIIATAYLAGYEHGRDDPPPWGIRWASYWWRLADVRVLMRPVHVEKGQLGLWRLTPEQEMEVKHAE